MTSAASENTTLFAPLENRTFRAIWLANQISSLGWLMQTVALSWLMATISTSDVMVALVQASSTLPAFFLAIFVGAVADNFSRRTIMIVGRSVMMAPLAMLTTFMVLGVSDPRIILGLSFLAGCGTAFHDPAWQASVGDIVERPHLPAAVTLISVGFNTVRSAGPALGGIVVAVFGLLATFALTSLGFAAPLTALWRNNWKVHSSSLPRESMTGAVHDGLRFVGMSSEIKATIARGMLFGVASSAMLPLLPLVVRDHLMSGPVTYGILMGGFGVGAFLGGLSNSRLRRSLTQERQIILACIACAGCSFSLAFTTSIAVATVALAVGGAGWVTAWSGLGVNVQLASPRWITGRTISIYNAFTYGAIAAGSWLWGTVAENDSLTSALYLSGGTLLLVAALGLKLPISNRLGSELEPSGEFTARAIALDLKPRSGPILITIEYSIPEENVALFLDVMWERRHVQSRAGARQWTLTRDVQETSRWLETYRTPTWTDYHRLHHRLTAADKLSDQELLKLSTQANPPLTSILIERPTGAVRRSYPTVAYVSQK